jgi:medium-chain acyl-[acyl-carrier-protein] hydrolase
VKPLAVKRYQPRDDAALRLFCLPYAGGGLGVYSDWPRALPQWVDVCSVELPGRDRLIGVPPLQTVPELVERVAASLEPWLDEPYALFGYSMGALLAFELARSLPRRPAALLVAAHRAPQLPDRREPLHPLPAAEFVAALARLEGTPPEVLTHPELMELYLPVLKADFALSETYRYIPGPPLAVPIFAYAASEDPEVPVDDVNAWRKQTARAFALRTCPGNHFFLRTAPLIHTLSADLDLLMATAARR